MTMPPRPEVVLLDVDEVGQRATSDGIGYYLTPCCSASVTGVSVTAQNRAGVACRACYRPVNPRLAHAWVGDCPTCDTPPRWTDGVFTCTCGEVFHPAE